MVEYTSTANSVFASLADPTRRDILVRVANAELSVGEIANHYQMTFAAVSKHLKILERANLISKRKEGKRYLVRARQEALQEVNSYLQRFKAEQQARHDRLETLLIKE